MMYELPQGTGAAKRNVDPCPLSGREVEVLKRLAEGKVYKQIAHELDALDEHGAHAPAQHLREARRGRPRPGGADRHRARLALVRHPPAVHGGAEEKVTFCRICEPLCGMVATVEDGKLVQLRPDADNPLSRGLRVPQGHRDDRGAERPRPRAAPAQAHRRPGEFERGRWDEALDDIGERLTDVLDEHGPASVGWYMGNPGAFSYSHTLWAKGFLDAIGSPHYYTRRLAGREQPLRRQRAAVRLAAGGARSPTSPRTDFLLMVGANPLVSHGSVLSAPRVREQLLGDRGARRPGRGGRPAPLGDRAPVRAPADPARRRRLAAALAAPHDLRRGPGRPRASSPSDAEGAGELERLARRAPAGGHRGRTGIAGRARPRARARLRRPPTAPPPTGAPARAWAASARWSPSCSTRSTRSPATSTARAARCSAARRSRSTRSASGSGLATYGKTRSRFGDFPDVLGNLPASLLPREIETPGRAPDPRAVRLRRQPGAVGARRRRARARARQARPDGVARLLRERDQPPRRLRAAHHHAIYERDDVPRRASSASSPAVHPDHRAGDRAARRGARGVGDHRRDLAPRSAWRPTACPRCGRWPSWASASRRSGWWTCCCAPGPTGDLFGAAARRAQSWPSCAATTRTGSCSPTT